MMVTNLTKVFLEDIVACILHKSKNWFILLQYLIAHFVLAYWMAMMVNNLTKVFLDDIAACVNLNLCSYFIHKPILFLL